MSDFVFISLIIFSSVSIKETNKNWVISNLWRQFNIPIQIKDVDQLSFGLSLYLFIYLLFFVAHFLLIWNIWNESYFELRMNMIFTVNWTT